MQIPKLRTAALTAALMTAAVPALPNSANAAWGWGHHGWGWGGFGVGLAAGALVGTALAAPYYGGYYGYGYPAYGYGYPAYSYDYDYGYPGYGYSSYGYAPAYYGGYGYASPYYGRRFYAYGGPYIHRHWVHRRYHYWH